MSKRKKEGRKNQHWVAASYLRSWCDPTDGRQNPVVWRISKDGSQIKPKSPENTFKENELYTIPKRDGSRNLVLEEVFGRLETQLREAVKRTFTPGGPISGDDAAAVMCFMAAQICRTPSFRDHQREQFDRVVKLGEELEQKINAMTPDKRMNLPPTLKGNGPSFTLDQMRAVRDEPLHLVGVPMMLELMKIFSRMNLCIIPTDDDIGFITSDKPCVTFDPELYKMPPIWRNISFGSPTVEITLPLTPHRLALLSYHSGLSGYWIGDGINKKMVDNLNHRTRNACHKEFVVRKRYLNPEWFKEITPPDDAWMDDRNDDKALR